MVCIQNTREYGFARLLWPGFSYYLQHSVVIVGYGDPNKGHKMDDAKLTQFCPIAANPVLEQKSLLLQFCQNTYFLKVLTSNCQVKVNGTILTKDSRPVPLQHESIIMIAGIPIVFHLPVSHQYLNEEVKKGKKAQLVNNATVSQPHFAQPQFSPKEFVKLVIQRLGRPVTVAELHQTLVANYSTKFRFWTQSGLWKGQISKALAGPDFVKQGAHYNVRHATLL